MTFSRGEKGDPRTKARSGFVLVRGMRAFSGKALAP